ncbi:hypothetical protein CRUP_017434, partial [Coryphaenoides rupestris]
EPGSRSCEELCRQRRGPEVFENQAETDYFYPIYIDIDECSDPEFPAGCNQKCLNFPGGFECMCEKGFYPVHSINCIDIDECRQYPSICAAPATCMNTPGSFECRCAEGFKYNLTSKSCSDVDECVLGVCDGVCVNTPGSFACHCDGRAGLHLGHDGRSCERVPVCLPLHDHTHPEMLYLGEHFSGLPLIYLLYRLPPYTRFSAEFDLRTFDPEGVVLYAEAKPGSWFLLGLRDGTIEVQFKNQHSFKVTSGGRAINTGEWHVVSVEELEGSLSVKVGGEAVMSISSPQPLFLSHSGKLETKIFIAGLPNQTQILKPMNPRLDGCLRGWNLLNQGSSGVKRIIHGHKSKHCLVSVETGSYFPGAGLARFRIPYAHGVYRVEVRLNLRPSSSTGVLFALVSNSSAPLTIAVVTQGENEANLQVFLEGVSVATLDSLMLCYPERMEVVVSFNTTHLLVSVQVNGVQLDLDEAEVKHNSIKSHSCPPFSAPHTQPHRK